jgi:hypothetical protein
MNAWRFGGNSGREPQPEPELRAEPPADPSSVFTVEFKVEGKLGLHLLRNTTERLFTVEFLSESGLAVNEPGIVPGCVLVAVQEQPLDGLTYDEGLELVRAAGRPLRLTFEPPPATPSQIPEATVDFLNVPPEQQLPMFSEEQELGLRIMPDSDAEEALLAELSAALDAEPAGQIAIDEPEFWLRASLRSRKFDVAESALLVRKYMVWREECSIATLGGIFNETLRAQLATGFMQLTGAHDRLGRQIIHVLAAAHGDHTDSFSVEETTRTVHFMIECCLRCSVAAQARGVVFIIDMKGASEGVITRCLRSLLPMLTAASLPLRVGRIYIINPPAFVKIVFPLASGLISQTMKKRLTFLAPGQLGELRRHIDDANLPAEYGGHLQSQHDAWVAALEGCLAADSQTLWPPLPVVIQLPGAPLPSAAAVSRFDPQARGRWELFLRFDGDMDGRLDRNQLHELLVRVHFLPAHPLPLCAFCAAWSFFKNLCRALRRFCNTQVQDVFHGEMDEGWFEEIWAEATAVSSTAVAATMGGSPEMIDYRSYVRLFDDTAADEDALEDAHDGNGDEEEKPFAGADNSVAMPALAPSISLPDDVEQPQLEPELQQAQEQGE